MKQILLLFGLAISLQTFSLNNSSGCAQKFFQQGILHHGKLHHRAGTSHRPGASIHLNISDHQHSVVFLLFWLPLRSSQNGINPRQ